MSWVPQVVIMLTGVTAVALSQSASARAQRFACIFGLVGQPFWFWAAISAEQWGIVAMCCLYTLAWARGVHTHWAATYRRARGRWLCGLGLHRWKRAVFYSRWSFLGLCWSGKDACCRCGRRRATDFRRDVR